MTYRTADPHAEVDCRRLHLQHCPKGVLCNNVRSSVGKRSFIRGFDGFIDQTHMSHASMFAVHNGLS